MVGVAAAEWFGAKYQNDSNAFPVLAVDPQRYLDMYPEFTIANDQRQAFIKTRTGAVAGKRLVERYGWRLGQKLPISSGDLPEGRWQHELGVRSGGPPRRRRSRRAWQHRPGADQWRVLRRGAPVQQGPYRLVHRTHRRCRPGQGHLGGDRRVVHELPDETKTQPEKEFAIGFAKQIGDIGVLVRRILVAVFFTLLILTGNTMAQSIRERLPEFAIPKTLGFSTSGDGAGAGGGGFAALLGGGLRMLAATVCCQP